MNTVNVKLNTEQTLYSSKLKEQLRRNGMIYQERTEGNSVIIQIRAKAHKESGHKEYVNTH